MASRRPARGNGARRVRMIALHAGQEIAVSVERAGSGYLVRMGERTFEADLVWVNHFARSLKLADSTQFLIGHSVEGTMHEISFGNRIVHVDLRDPLAMRGERVEGAGAGSLKAIMPGRIVRILVSQGDAVKKGTGLLVLEAMKMENEIQSPSDGVVSEIFVQQGQTVETGTTLVEIE
jgi:biotin carboxyl carrier protein